MKFPRIRIININNINRSLSILCNRITELEETVKEIIECGNVESGTITSDESAQTINAPEPVAETAVNEPTLSDESKDNETDGDSNTWLDITDPSTLKEFALETWGLEIKGNKKVETIVAEIREHIEGKGTNQ